MVREQALKHRGCWILPRVSLREDEGSSVSLLQPWCHGQCRGPRQGGWALGGVCVGWGLNTVLWARWAHGWLLLAVLLAGGWEPLAPLMPLPRSGAQLRAGVGSACPARGLCPR